MRIMRDRRTGKGMVFIKSVALLAALCALSLSIAYAWHTLQITSDSPQFPSDPEEVRPGDREEGDAPTLQAADETGEDEAAPVSANRPPPAAMAVAQSDRVDNRYFSDAIFFGDSISTGIPLYKVAGNPHTVAWPGLNPLSINTEAVFGTGGEGMTALEYARQYGEKKKVYIMLGGNGLWMERQTFLQGYQSFLDGVKEQYPDAVVYLQSILPVTRDAYNNYELANNDTIREFNGWIQELARLNGVQYLDVAQAVMDDNGDLPAEASPLDGMHLTPEYYHLWFEYLKNHTVEDLN